jgi:hypothetical protein
LCDFDLVKIFCLAPNDEDPESSLLVDGADDGSITFGDGVAAADIEDDDNSSSVVAPDQLAKDERSARPRLSTPESPPPSVLLLPDAESRSEHEDCLLLVCLLPSRLASPYPLASLSASCADASMSAAQSLSPKRIGVDVQRSSVGKELGAIDDVE